MSILNKYRKLFSGLVLEKFPYSEKYFSTMPERDMDLADLIFSAENNGRIFQLSFESDAVPVAFIKKCGINFENLLLQVLIPIDYSNFFAVLDLFKYWILEEFDDSRINEIISEAGFSP